MCGWVGVGGGGGGGKVWMSSDFQKVMYRWFNI